jgi:hypothetical protein
VRERRANVERKVGKSSAVYFRARRRFKAGAIR